MAWKNDQTVNDLKTDNELRLETEHKHHTKRATMRNSNQIFLMNVLCLKGPFHLTKCTIYRIS